MHFHGLVRAHFYIECQLTWSYVGDGVCLPSGAGAEKIKGERDIPSQPVLVHLLVGVMSNFLIKTHD